LGIHLGAIVLLAIRAFASVVRYFREPCVRDYVNKDEVCRIIYGMPRASSIVGNTYFGVGGLDKIDKAAAAQLTFASCAPPRHISCSYRSHLRGPLLTLPAGFPSAVLCCIHLHGARGAQLTDRIRVEMCGSF